MKFRTEIPCPTYPFKIDYNSKILLFGSCFSDHFGSIFQQQGFETLSNPFGTLFNPISIANALKMSINTEIFNEDYIDFFNEKWISYAHHGKFSHPDRATFLQNIQAELEKAHQFLKNCDYLFITFGTAFCYELIERKIIVANCHKIPAQKFEKRLFSIEDFVKIYKPLLADIFEYNSKLKMIFTVSPVRHLGDGFHENQLSKSILHLTENELIKSKNCFYFPSYEIIQDDLRDYRFYGNDLCHPSESAVSYIGEILMESFFTKETKEKALLAVKANKAKGHISHNILL